MNTDIIDAINGTSAHDFATELEYHHPELDITRRGNYGAGDEAFDIAGYGTVFFDRQSGWVVTSCSDGFDYPVDADELREDIARMIRDKEAVL